ncbi:hypothetical protein TSTA_001110 [Talaromyces stipitatus ATCC 10500]|uniref:Uncharacterized protein n=1 Tax=Talaromyces stipitatus (strain ATCC 10500 / CBS 375.48 / QM 6759 / NRRL 1006) TaxID=441959 RepID=B8MT15_TALSN|nr:uncharacterized protein TSTA_001110 [Talaromyces stipitatus ATCC 10500]EED12039.1 hypothetical protein TSTA_001110 [Talaromyces stipitatus ATCC 10500]
MGARRLHLNQNIRRRKTDSNASMIWNPHTGRIVRARDVLFNKKVVFSGKKEDLEDDLLYMTIKEITQLLNKVDLSAQQDVSGTDDNVITDIDDVIFDDSRHSDEDINMTSSAIGSGLEDLNQPESNLTGPTLAPGEGLLEGIDKYAYPTPPNTPPSALLAGSITIVQEDDLTFLRQSSKLGAGKSTGEAGATSTLVQEAVSRASATSTLGDVGKARATSPLAEFGASATSTLDLRDTMRSSRRNHSKLPIAAALTTQ